MKKNKIAGLILLILAAVALYPIFAWIIGFGVDPGAERGTAGLFFAGFFGWLGALAVSA